MSRLTSKNEKHWRHMTISYSFVFLTISESFHLITILVFIPTLLNLMLLWIYSWQNIIEVKTKKLVCLQLLRLCSSHSVTSKSQSHHNRIELSRIRSKAVFFSSWELRNWMKYWTDFFFFSLKRLLMLQ